MPWPCLRICCLALAIICRPSLAQSPQDLSAQAAQAMQHQDYATAEKLYLKLIELVPSIGEMHSNYGMACYLQNKLSCAEAAFSRAIHLKPELFLPNFLLGEIYFKQGKYEDALPVLEQAVSTQPGRKEVRKLFVATLVGTKQYDRAIHQCEKYLAANPTDPDNYYCLGSVYLELGQHAMAKLARFEGVNFAKMLTAERLVPDEEKLYSREKTGAEQLRLLALNTYQDAFTTPIDIQGARLGYAKVQIASKDWAGARTSLQLELRKDPRSYRSKYHLARVALGESSVVEAAGYLDDAIEIRPEFFEPLPDLRLKELGVRLNSHEETLKKQAGQGSFGAALLLSSFDDDGKRRSELREWSNRAERMRQEILRRMEAESSVKVSSAAHGPDALTSVGLDLLRRKRYEDGLEILFPIAQDQDLPLEANLETARALFGMKRYRDLVEVFGETEIPSPEMIYLIGSAYRQLALENFEKMVGLDPESARAHEVLGDAHFAQERYVEATEEYGRALDLEPKNAELYFLLGNSYYKQLQFPLAAETFERTIQLNPFHAEAHLMLGDSLVQMGKNGGAIVHLGKSLELNPKLDQAHVLLGKAYRATGDLESALSHLEKGAGADQDGSVHYQLFVLYRNSKQPEKAKAALRKSQELRKQSVPRTELAQP